MKSDIESIKIDLSIEFNVYPLDEETFKYLRDIDKILTEKEIMKIMNNTIVFLAGTASSRNTITLFYEYENRSIDFTFAIKEEKDSEDSNSTSH